MSEVKISSFPTNPNALIGTELLTGLLDGINTNFTSASTAALARIPFVYIGSSPLCQYPTMQAAIADGELNLYVITDITETIAQTFSGELTVIFAPGVNITFNDASPFTCTASESVLALIAEGSGCQWILNYTTNNSVVNMDAVIPSPPSKMTGTFLIQANVDSSIAVKPVSSRAGEVQGFVIEGVIIYVGPNNIGSYFDFDQVSIDGFFVGVGSGVATRIINIELGGTISNLLLVGTFDISSPLVTLQDDSSIGKITSLVSDTSASVYIKNSSLSNVEGGSFSLTVILDSDGSQCSLSNADNVNLILQGSSGSIDNVNLSGFDDSAVTTGIFNFEKLTFSSSPNFSATNGSVNYNFVNCSCSDGFNSMLSFSKWINCTAGNLSTPGGLSTFTIPSTADSVQLYNCISDNTLVDNGTNSSYSYKIF